jgi:ABC-type multidrug transport system fused ATPase/permease subunit
LAFGALLAGVAMASAVGVNELSSVAAVLLMMLRALSYGQQLQTAAGSLAMAIPSIEQVDEAIAGYGAHSTPTGSRTPKSIAPIECAELSYSYDGKDAVLKGLTFRVEDGEVLGIIGPSGAGKSTLLQLLLALRPPTSGSIRAAGVDVADISSSVWRQRVAFVPQEAHLLTATVEENVRFFRDGISTDAVRGAVHLAGLLGDIEALPKGFETFLGERGSRLSGGQRQRLSIARAIAGGPELLILDEPTSALDIQSESIIRETLLGLRGSVTVIVVAHRMTTLEACDRLAVVEEGRLTAIGTPDELLRSSDFYRRAVAPAG